MEMRNIKKSFAAVQALRGVDLTLQHERSARTDGRQRCRQVDPDEGPQRGLHPR